MWQEYPFGTGIVKWTSTEWLEEHLGDESFMIIDVQPDIHDYITEHIPGSVYFNQKLLRIPYKGIPGKFVPEGIIKQLFGRIGLKPDLPIIVYTGTGSFRGWGDGLEQTMVAYSLARFGHNKVWLLDGGLDKWKKENRVLTKEFPRIEESVFPVNLREDFFVNIDQVKEMKDREDVILLDARPPDMYEGQSIWTKPGHIPGAVNLPWKSLMNQENTRLLKSGEELKKILDQHNVSRDKTIICSCGTGRESTNEFILLKYFFDFPKVKNYEGSMTEWTAYPENPTVTGKKPR